MARTHRSTSSTDSENLPRYFGKHTDQQPAKVKKNGSGKFNWGNAYDDIDDLESTSEFSFAHARRRSNSSSHQQAPVRPTHLVYDDDVFDESDE